MMLLFISLFLHVGSWVGDFENINVSFINWLSTQYYGPPASPFWQEGSAMREATLIVPPIATLLSAPTENQSE